MYQKGLPWRKHFNQGFTLVEMLGVLLILGVVLGLTASLVRNRSDGRRRQIAVDQMVAGLQRARTEAITYAGPVGVIFDTVGQDGPGYCICRLIAGPGQSYQLDEQIGPWRRLPEGVVFVVGEGDATAPNLMSAVESTLEVPRANGSAGVFPYLLFGSGGEVLSPSGAGLWTISFASGGVVDGEVLLSSGRGGGERGVERLVLRRATGRARALQ